MGGASEIMVKLTKCALKTVTNDRPMYDVLRTFIVEVESMLYSRYVTSVSDDYSDLQYDQLGITF